MVAPVRFHASGPHSAHGATVPRSAIAFLGIVLALAAGLVLAVRNAGRRLGESPPITRRWTLVTAIAIVAWLGVTAAASGSGLLGAATFPPPLMVFFAIRNLVAIGAASSPLGTRLVTGLPIAWLVGFQAFRLPLELVLHQWYAEGVLPIQMTYAGHNFDIVTGISALAAALALHRRGHTRTPRALVLAFNLLGLGLLLTVMTIAVLSSPIPLRQYTNDPPVLLALHIPYVWIVSICVSGALFGHLLLFRWLSRARAQRLNSSPRDDTSAP